MITPCIQCGSPNGHVYFEHGDDGPYCARCSSPTLPPSADDTTPPETGLTETPGSADPCT